MNENTERVLKLPTITQKTDEWYRIRNNLLTASDCAAVLGMNPYKTRNKLLKEKTGLKKAFTGNHITEYGNKYEPEAIQMYEDLYGEQIYETGLYIHRDYPWLGASPDGITESGCLAEVKCPIKRPIQHLVPAHYYPQIQIQLEVLDIDVCKFIQYKPATDDDDFILDVLNVKRNKEWFEEHFESLKSFAEDVENQKQKKISIDI